MGTKYEVMSNLDILTCVEIVRSTFDKSYLIPSKYRSTNIELLLKYELLNPKSVYFFRLLKIEQKIVAFAELRKVNEIIYLNIIAVDNSYTHKQLGTTFLTKIIDEFRKYGFRRLQLDVFDSNKQALYFYSKFNSSNLLQRYFIQFSSPQKSLNPSLRILNFPQFHLEKERIGYSFLKILHDDKLHEITCINNDLICSNEAESELAYNLVDVLNIDNIYFFSNTSTNAHLTLNLINTLSIDL